MVTPIGPGASTPCPSDSQLRCPYSQLNLTTFNHRGYQRGPDRESPKDPSFLTEGSKLL